MAHYWWNDGHSTRTQVSFSPGSTPWHSIKWTPFLYQTFLYSAIDHTCIFMLLPLTPKTILGLQLFSTINFPHWNGHVSFSSEFVKKEELILWRAKHCERDGADPISGIESLWDRSDPSPSLPTHVQAERQFTKCNFKDTHNNHSGFSLLRLNM